MKRFYKQAEAGTAPGGFVIRLDGKVLKTPLHRNLILSSRTLAEKIASEWNAQGEEIVPSSMPFFQLANTMADKASGEERAALEDEVVKYGASDLVCYFASHPADLVRRQEESWRPLIAWLQDEWDIALETVSGIRYMNQPEASVSRLRALVKSLGAAEFTVMQAATGISGSAVIALALTKGKVGAQEAWRAACVDEIYQLEKWGEDALARKRLNRIEGELAQLQEFSAMAKEEIQ